jgi:molybdopterin-containing oxidoreductase family iron-sulfur binding subunit
VYVGARRSLTGLNADQWIPTRPGSDALVARAVTGGAPIADAAAASGVPEATLEALAAELRRAGAGALVIAGGTGADALDTARAAAQANRTLGSVGRTVLPARPLRLWDGVATHAQVRAATARMAAGEVAIAFVRGANPAFAAPAGLAFADAFAKVPFKVAFTNVPDETAELCDLVLPDHHSLEAWGDAQPLDGTYGLQQPVMDPVFDSRSTADVLLAVAKADTAVAARFPAADYRAWLAGRLPGGDAQLARDLARGIATGGAALARTQGPAAVAATAPAAPGAGEYFLHVYHSPTLGDGRGANKPWLQELADPVTKTVWQTVVELHPETAKALGVAQGDHVTVTTATGALTAPAWLYIGIRPDTVAVMTGRGHTAYGRYAKDCGANPLTLLAGGEDGGGGFALTHAKAQVAKAGASSLIVTLEGSGRQHDRGIARAFNVGVLLGTEEDHSDPHHHEFPGDASHEFLPGLRSPVAADAQGDLADPASAQKGQYDPEHWSGVAKRRWAMVVDLARCTGCSACVTACHAENNIPTVGAPWQGAQVMPDRTGFGANITRSREMAWIRLERYWEIDREPKDVAFDPAFETRFVPMMCQHCGNAPCEPVCPVYATYHAPDGLNVQVYNRCVGTRYCSNNCPYKVRYFNWFGYGEVSRPQYAFPAPLDWQLNPDVTVRGKGVMEKCTFCVQRIREAEHRVKLENRAMQPDEFTTACAQACPSRAIVFGDAADEQWTVAKAAKDRRAYHVFEELNTYTAVVYLKKVNHPAPAAPAQA